MKKVAFLFATAATLSACGHGPAYYSGPDPYYAPPPSHHYRPLDTVGPAVAMCEVDTLAEQRLAMLEEVHGYREAIRAEPGYRSDVADTQTQELIAAFETDLDASYRFATASCRTYNRCLEENRFTEGACQDTASLWHDGQDRFHDLSERLAMVRERIASDCYDCRPDRYGHHDARYHDRHHDRHDRYRRDDLIGSVFSTDPY